MADTLEGRRLTDAHRIAQVQLSVRAVAAAQVIWDQFGPSDITSQRGEWLALQVALLRVFDGRSAGLAADYLGRFRQVEGSPGGPLVGVADFSAPWAFGSMTIAGPQALLAKVSQGILPTQAKAEVWGNMQGAVQRQALQGGRRVVDESALANPDSVGWRRVTDSDPCAFCAMLAARGPRFRSESSAGAGRDWHYKCGCSIEEVFGTWRPTEAEKRYAAAYETAADAVDGPRTAKSVTTELRKLGYR